MAEKKTKKTKVKEIVPFEDFKALVNEFNDLEDYVDNLEIRLSEAEKLLNRVAGRLGIDG